MSGGFHDDGIDAGFLEPFHQCFEVFSTAPKGAYAFLGALGCNSDPMFGTADINGCCIGVGDLQSLGRVFGLSRNYSVVR